MCDKNSCPCAPCEESSVSLLLNLIIVIFQTFLFSQCPPKCYTAQQLRSMPQCPANCPPQKCGPQFVKIQQPPRMMCQKNVIYTKKTVIDKHVVPECKTICEPRLIYQEKTITEPCIIYKKRVIREPRIIYEKKVIQDPKIVCQARTIVEPKEICQNILCQPKPQTIQIPDPNEFICTPAGASFVNRQECPPIPMCKPMQRKQFNC